MPEYDFISRTSLFSFNLWAMCFPCVCREAKWLWRWGFWKTFSKPPRDWYFWRCWDIFWSSKCLWDPIDPLRRSRGVEKGLVFTDLTSWITRTVGETESRQRSYYVRVALENLRIPFTRSIIDISKSRMTLLLRGFISSNLIPKMSLPSHFIGRDGSRPGEAERTFEPAVKWEIWRRWNNIIIMILSGVITTRHVS